MALGANGATGGTRTLKPKAKATSQAKSCDLAPTPSSKYKATCETCESGDSTASRDKSYPLAVTGRKSGRWPVIGHL